MLSAIAAIGFLILVVLFAVGAIWLNYKAHDYRQAKKPSVAESPEQALDSSAPGPRTEPSAQI